MLRRGECEGWQHLWCAATGPPRARGRHSAGHTPARRGGGIRGQPARAPTNHTCQPQCDRACGNPVLWGERFIPEMRALAGDVGARHLIGEYAELVHEVEMDDDAIFVDVDDQAAFAAVTGPT